MTADPTSVTTWWDSITWAVSDAWAKILSFLPNLIGAFVIILIGLLVAWVLKWVVVQVLNAIRLQVLSDKVKFTDVLSKMGVKQTVSELLGNLVKWVVVIVFLLPALEVLGLTEISDVLSQILGYLPKVVIAGFLVFVGIVIADIVAHVIKATAITIGTTTAQILASVARYSILVFVALAALTQLGVATNLLLTLFTGFVGMIAIAGGIAFGLGGKDAAADLIRKIREDFSKK
jgi:hypothetical protein